MHIFRKSLFTFLVGSLTLIAAGPLKADLCDDLWAKIQYPKRAHNYILSEAGNKINALLLSQKSVGDIVDAAAEEDLRNHVFRIEAVLRDFNGSEDAPADIPNDILSKKEKAVLKRAGHLAEALEDILGDYTDTIEHLKKLDLIIKSKKGKAVSRRELQDLKLFFEQEHAAQKIKFENFLKDGRWLSEKGPLKDLNNSIEIVAKIKRKASRKIFVRAITENLKMWETQMEAIVGDGSKPLTDLDDQVHAPRRWLRWFMLMVGSANLFTLEDSPSPLPEFAKVEIDDETIKKYGHVGINGVEESPIEINRFLYYGYVKFVADLGAAKDIGQFEEALARGAEAQHYSPRKSQLIAMQLAQLLPGYVEPYSLALRQLKKITRSGLLKTTRHQIEKQ